MTRRLSLATAATILALAAGCGDDTPAPSGSTPSASGGTPSAPATATATASPEPSEEAPTARFAVADGRVVSGPRTVEVAVGTRVVIEVVTDKEDELHVHGYDKEVGVKPDRPARVEFTADVAGVFEVELHSGVRLCNLRVR